MLDRNSDEFLTWAEIIEWQDELASTPTPSAINVVRRILGLYDGNFFEVDTPLTVLLRINKHGAQELNRLEVRELAPKGWQIVPLPNKCGATATIKTGVAATMLHFLWEEAPTFPIELQYQLIPPASAVGMLAMLGHVAYELDDESGASGLLPTIVAKALPPEAAHSADTDGNWRISLSELLRVILFYNFGAYHVSESSEDGYAPGLGDMIEGWNHAADFDGNWRISLPELLRMIQLYKSDSRFYYADGESMDGYTPAPF